MCRIDLCEPIPQPQRRSRVQPWRVLACSLTDVVGWTGGCDITDHGVKKDAEHGVAGVPGAAVSAVRWGCLVRLLGWCGWGAWGGGRVFVRGLPVAAGCG
eukprot:gene763-biopygen4770